MRTLCRWNQRERIFFSFHSSDGASILIIMLLWECGKVRRALALERPQISNVNHSCVIALNLKTEWVRSIAMRSSWLGPHKGFVICVLTSCKAIYFSCLVKFCPSIYMCMWLIIAGSANLYESPLSFLL